MLSIVNKARENCTICSIGKLHVSKDGRHTVCADSHNCFIHVYTPRNKFFTHKNPFTQVGPAEVEGLITSMTSLIKTNKKDRKDEC